MRLLTDPAAAGWPLAASLAIALVGQSMRFGRRRRALNEALHELRRPLQALCLMPPRPVLPSHEQPPGSLQLALSALARLDRELNGGSPEWRPGPVPCRQLLEVAVGRWRSRAAIEGGRIELRWRAGAASLRGDEAEISRALDNLIVNAIEHGGPMIRVEASRRGRRLRIAVADSGLGSRPKRDDGAGGDGRPMPGAEVPAAALARLSGRRRHGHGLAVVRRVAASHGGRFALERSARGTLAVLELPIAGEQPSRAA